MADPENIEISIKVKGEDALVSLEKLRKALRDVDQSSTTMRARSELTGLSGVAQRVSYELSSTLRIVGGLGGLIGGGIVASVIAIGASLASWGRAGVQLHQTAEELGTTAEVLTKYQYAAQAAGASSDQAAAGVQNAFRRLQDLKWKGGLSELWTALVGGFGDRTGEEFANALIQTVRSSGTEAAFDQLLTRLSDRAKSGDIWSQSVLRQIFGLAEGVPWQNALAMAEKFKNATVANKEAAALYQAQIAELGYHLTNFRNTIGNAVLPSFIELSKRLNAWVEGDDGKAFAKSLEEMAKSLEQLPWEKIAGGVNYISASIREGFPNINQEIATVARLVAMYDEVIKRAEDARNAVKDKPPGIQWLPDPKIWSGWNARRGVEPEGGLSYPWGQQQDLGGVTADEIQRSPLLRDQRRRVPKPGGWNALKGIFGLGGAAPQKFTDMGGGGGTTSQFHPSPNFLSGSPFSTNIEDRRATEELTDQMHDVTDEVRRLNDILKGAAGTGGSIYGGGAGGMGVPGGRGWIGGGQGSTTSGGRARTRTGGGGGYVEPSIGTPFGPPAGRFTPGGGGAEGDAGQAAFLTQHRAGLMAELNSDPAKMDKFMGLVEAETGGQGPEAWKAKAETTLDRWAHRGQNVDEGIASSYYGGNPRYKTPSSGLREAFPGMMAGIGKGSASFPGATGNASNEPGNPVLSGHRMRGEVAGMAGGEGFIYEPKDRAFRSAVMAARSGVGSGFTTATVRPSETGSLVGFLDPQRTKLAMSGVNTAGVPSAILENAKQVALTGGMPAVDKYMRDQGYPRSGNWCGQFAAAIVKGAGGTPPKDPGVASNWRNWGAPTDQPQPGDIAVRKGVPTSSLGSHVTIVESTDTKAGMFKGLGGNQGGGRVSPFAIDEYGFRRGSQPAPIQIAKVRPTTTDTAFGFMSTLSSARSDDAAADRDVLNSSLSRTMAAATMMGHAAIDIDVGGAKKDAEAPEPSGLFNQTRSKAAPAMPNTTGGKTGDKTSGANEEE